MKWLERTRQRTLRNPITDAGSDPLVAVVDVGGGEAETVAYVCEFKSDLPKIIRMGAPRGDDTRGRMVSLLNEFRSRLSLVRVDAVGICRNFALYLRDCRFRVEMVNVGMPCESKPQMGRTIRRGAS